MSSPSHSTSLAKIVIRIDWWWSIVDQNFNYKRYLNNYIGDGCNAFSPGKTFFVRRDSSRFLQERSAKWEKDKAHGQIHPRIPVFSIGPTRNESYPHPISNGSSTNRFITIKPFEQEEVFLSSLWSSRIQNAIAINKTVCVDWERCWFKSQISHLLAVGFGQVTYLRGLEFSFINNNT